jgi:predicted regulator of Ras-like GTPase activity (Roadblock/LC7/MglB family)
MAQRSASLTTALREVGEEHESVIAGMLVANGDGEPLGVEARLAEVDLVASMSVVAADTAARIAAEAGVGQYTTCLIEGTSGHVTVHPLAADTVLVLFGRHGVTPGRLATTAKRVLPRLREVAAEVRAPGEPDLPPDATLPAPVRLDDLPRIDLSPVDDGRPQPATPDHGRGGSTEQG